MSQFSRWRVFWEAIRFSWHARTIDGLDSPWLASFYDQVVRARYSPVKEIEEIRSNFRKQRSRITNKQQSGTISKRSATLHISEFAKVSATPPWKCALLCKIVCFFNGGRILELGTGLGIASRYLINLPETQYFRTVEGNPLIYRENALRSTPTIKTDHGQFEDILKQLTESGEKYDVIFVDGDHQLDSQLLYLPYLARLLTPHGVLIYDDIYWSASMKSLWQELKRSNRFNVSIDLFSYGILAQVDTIKQPIDIRLSPLPIRWKPGLFR